MYVIIEMQTNGNTTVLTPPIVKETLDEAESAYHQILAAAAISQVEKHAAVILDEQGAIQDKRCYYHGNN